MVPAVVLTRPVMPSVRPLWVGLMMKKQYSTWVAAIIVAPLLFGCGRTRLTTGNSLNTDSDLSYRCVQALAELAKASGASLYSSGDRLTIGDHELRFHPRIENDQRAQSQHLVGLAVDVFINSVPQPLTAGSVGIGTTRQEAVESAVIEWAQLAGVGLLGAFGINQSKAPALSVGAFSVHPGATGIRGAQGVDWSGSSHQQVLDSLKPIITELESSPSEFHSVFIMVVVKPSGSTEGECRIDGIVSQKVLSAVKHLRWPPAEETYMFKQFYVLRRRKK